MGLQSSTGKLRVPPRAVRGTLSVPPASVATGLAAHEIVRGGPHGQATGILDWGRVERRFAGCARVAHRLMGRLTKRAALDAGPDGGRSPEIRAIPAGDEAWVSIVRHIASKAGSVAELEATLRLRYPDAVVHASTLDGLYRPVWYVYKRRWFERP